MNKLCKAISQFNQLIAPYIVALLIIPAVAMIANWIIIENSQLHYYAMRLFGVGLIFACWFNITRRCQ